MTVHYLESYQGYCPLGNRWHHVFSQGLRGNQRRPSEDKGWGKLMGGPCGVWEQGAGGRKAHHSCRRKAWSHSAHTRCSGWDGPEVGALGPVPTLRWGSLGEHPGVSKALVPLKVLGTKPVGQGLPGFQTLPSSSLIAYLVPLWTSRLRGQGISPQERLLSLWSGRGSLFRNSLWESGEEQSPVWIGLSSPMYFLHLGLQKATQRTRS